MMAVLLGESVPRVDLVMGLIGGALTGPLMFILPPIFYARLRAMQPQPEIVAISGTTFQGLRKNLITILDIHSSVDSYEELRRQALKVENYGTFGDENLSMKRPEWIKEEIYNRSRTPVFQNVSYFKDRMLSLVSLENYAAIGPMVFWEKMFTACIVISGIVATVLSTYFSAQGAIRYATFVPPCLVNVTVASEAVIENAF